MIETETCLGPARVTRSEGRRDHVEIVLPSGDRAWTRLAFVFPYAPQVGDELLVTSQDGEAFYAIGLLKRKGNLRVSGEFSLEASGRIRLQSEDCLEASAPHMDLRAGRLQVFAERFVQKVNDVYQWISGLFHLKANRVRARAKESMNLQAHRTYMRADTDVNIDGKSINLG